MPEIILIVRLIMLVSALFVIAMAKSFQRGFLFAIHAQKENPMNMLRLKKFINKWFIIFGFIKVKPKNIIGIHRALQRTKKDDRIKFSSK